MTEYTGGSSPNDFTGGQGLPQTAGIGAGQVDSGGGDGRGGNEIRRRVGSHMSRAKIAREARRTQQFAKFRLTELNLVPLVDTFVSIVFFALTTATVGELAPVAEGVNLPSASVGNPAMQELTVGIGAPGISVGTTRVMSYADAARAQSNVPSQPLIIPQLYTALKLHADSLRQSGNVPADASVTQKLAVQGDRTMRYDMLSRIVQTARWAGFRNISLQVNRTGDPSSKPATGS